MELDWDLISQKISSMASSFQANGSASANIPVGSIPVNTSGGCSGASSSTSSSSGMMSASSENIVVGSNQHAPVGYYWVIDGEASMTISQLIVESTLRINVVFKAKGSVIKY